MISGLAPTAANGNFSQYTGANANNLTKPGILLTINAYSSPQATNLEVCGNDGTAGALLVYTLPSATYGYDLTNITVYGGWQDSGRDSQAYTVYYSTVANPGSFSLLAVVNYSPLGVPGGTGSANRVIIADASGAAIARSVAALKFDFTTPASENGSVGYTAITAQGSVATNLNVPPITITMDNQNSGSSFAATWTIESDSLIAGQLPSGVGGGNFASEGVAGLGALTDGIFGDVATFANYAACGNSAGQSVTYYLGSATLTNIVVYSGWQDVGRDGQFYNISYSTVAAPATFVPLTSVSYNPPVGGVSANRVGISRSTGGPLATNVAFITFDFTPQNNGNDNGYSGYAEIILEGTNASSSAATSVAMNTDFPTSSASSADSTLVFNEIMYHPATNENGMEFVEFYNQMAVDLDISGWRASGDTAYTFPAGTRVAGRSYIVLAHDPAQLMAATGLSSNVFGPFVSPLNNQGGTLELYNNSGRLMDAVTFGTSGDWPVTPDGAGPSLAKLDRDWGSASAANWAASWQNGGTPGAANFVSPPAPVTVVFNEHSGTTNAMFWVELFNYGTNMVSLGNCILHHDGVTNTDYLFPPNVTINAGSFLALSNSTLGFISPATGEKLFLFATNYSAVYDGLVLKKTPRARSPDGTGTWLVPNLPTPGASNSFTAHTELVINEIMYKHKDFPALDTNSLPQSNPEAWLELYNRSSNAVTLAGWTLSGGISYSFSASKTIAPGGYLVVAKDATTLHASYPAIDIVGNYSGNLSHNDDTIILNDPLGNPANTVHYYPGGRWPEPPGGGGPSLELRDPNADNSKGEAWAPSREISKSAWQTYTYRMVAQPSATSAPDDQWHDFILGLLTDGECLVDDISVIQSPTNNPVQLIGNGNFENGLSGWRVLGNHGRSVLTTDPDNAGNHVLHIVSSGPQEHMHNHIEQTLAGGASVINGTLYEISYRARWISGNHLLNTRLHYDRVAHTTALAYPQLNGTPGTANSSYATNIGPTFAQFQHQPMVPLANQLTTVFVRAQDPQGVAACSVFWSVNGGAWSNAPMTLSNGAYAGTIPKQPTSSVVQFYVQAIDGLGAVATFPAKGTNSGAFYRVNDGLGDLTQAHTIRILMSPANISLQYATTNLMSNENLPCTVIYDDRVAYYDMLVRLKSSERGRVDPNRIGFHLEFHPDELFRGVHPVMLADRSGGGGRPQQEEIVLKHMVNHVGVPEVNSDLCRIIAPLSAQNGWAILFPRFEDNFASTTFSNGSSGILHEFELSYYPLTADAGGYKLPAPDNVQGVDISDLGNDKETYRYNFIIKNHRNTDDYSTFINFAKQWNLNGTALDTETQATMDVDEWLSVYAMVSLCGVSDMYTFGGQHNLMTYIRPTDNRVLYLPWDMDFSFSQAVNAPLVGSDNFSKIVNLFGNLRRFYAHIQDDIATTYNATYIAPWISHYQSFPGQDWSGDLGYITQRGSYALSVINGAGGNTPFSVGGSNPSNVTNNNLITLSGTAPVQITSFLINGVSYPVTWSSIFNWSVQVALTSRTNLLSILGYDLHGNLVTNSTRTVVFTGLISDPSKTVVFNEIMCHPSVTNAEYVEIYNSSTNFSFDLTGWRVNGLGYDFPTNSILSPGQFLVLAKDVATYTATYTNSLAAFDQFTGSLAPDGETLTLFRPDPTVTNTDLVVDRVRYEPVAPWPVITNGASLQLIDAAQDNSRVADWTAVPSTASPTLQWVRASATGVPRFSGSPPLYIYLQSAGDIYVDDVSVVAGSVAEAGVNIVTNGGFETSLTPWTIGSDGNNSASVVSTAFKHSGNSSLHLIASSGGTTQNSSIWENFSGNLTVGATYTLSFWYLQSTNGGPLTARFSGSGISITTNPVPAAVVLPVAKTPNASNSVAATLPVFPALWLNELQAVNFTGPTNNFGTNAPWIELYNPGTNSLSLAGIYLANNYTNLTQWAFATNVIIRSNGFLVVWCDGLTNQSTTNAPHTSFTLAVGAGSVALSRFTNGASQIVDYLNYTNLPANWSYGDYPDAQPFYRQTMFIATPNTFNTNIAAPITVSINEWMADNTHTVVNPSGGKFDDWFELYNYGTNAVDLGGYYLTGTLTNKTKFQIPNNQHYLILPKSFFVVWADNLNASNSLSRPELHANFKLSKAGDAIGLFAADGTTVDALSFGVQTSDVTQGRFPDGSQNIFSMPTPTPQTNNLIPNTAPLLATIGDRFVHVGQSVQFTVTATDAQSAYQSLTFSLSNAPAGASINATSGAFQWTATNAIAPGTNVITVRVTDNGTPTMSDAKNFSVFVSSLPQFTGVVLGGNGQFQLTFNTLPGQNYQIQYKTNLTDATWISLGGPLAGTGNPRTTSDDISGSQQRFYRVLALP